MGLPIRDKRQFFTAPCLFYFTVSRSPEKPAEICSIHLHYIFHRDFAYRMSPVPYR